MRVVTLLPAATEIVAALGGAGSLVGISHECDHPASVLGLPRVTATPIDPGAAGAAIDAEVRRLHGAGKPVIGVDADALRRLAPDLLITQDLCEVCAVAEGEVHRLAAAVQPAPAVLALSGRTIDGIWADVRAVAQERSISRLRETSWWPGSGAGSRGCGARSRGARPRVVCVEWLEPLYLAGHWVPEMVEAAGGEDVGASAGEPFGPAGVVRAARAPAGSARDHALRIRGRADPRGALRAPLARGRAPPCGRRRSGSSTGTPTPPGRGHGS